jgi:hypothetical protein
MGLVRQAVKEFGLVGAWTPELGWHGEGGQALLGPSDVQHNAEPDKSKQGELVVQKM